MPARGYQFFFYSSFQLEVEYEKIKFVSTSGHVIFCLLYKRIAIFTCRRNRTIFSKKVVIQSTKKKNSKDF